MNCPFEGSLSTHKMDDIFQMERCHSDLQGIMDAIYDVDDFCSWKALLGLPYSLPDSSGAHQCGVELVPELRHIDVESFIKCFR